MKIIINCRTEELPDGVHVLSYENIAAMAGYDQERLLTIMYSKKVPNQDGSMTPGDVVTVSEGMIISVADTGNA